MSNLLKRLFESGSRNNAPSNAARRCSRRAAIEQLEDRQLLAVTAELGAALPVAQADQTVYEASAAAEDLAIDLAELETPDYVVTTTEDIVDANDGVLSLREAIAAAQDGETIGFSQDLGGYFVVNVTSELDITTAITIDGGGRVVLDGANRTHLMTIDAGAEAQHVQLLGLTFQNASCCDPNATVVDVEAQVHKDGGALYVSGDSYVDINDSVFRNNVTQAYGGAIASHGNLTLNNVEFYNNQAKSGAAIEIVEGDFTGYNLAFDENYASQDGGAIHLPTGSAYIYDSVFCSNAAEDRGGAIYSEKHQLNVYGSVFYGNTASEGGAIYDEYQYNYTSLYNCTIAGNSAKRGGGFYSLAKGVKLYNTIITNNFAFEDPNLYGQARFSSNNWLDKDVMFVEAPQFNANGTLKNFWTLDLRLLSTSAAVDGGKTSYVKTDLDFLGNPRVVGDAVDIGAYEYQGYDLSYEADVAGKVRIDTTLTASIVGETSGELRYYWFVSDTEDGELTLIEGADQKTYKAPDEYLGKYLTAVVATDTYAAKTTVGPLDKAKLCKRIIHKTSTSDKIVLSWTDVPNAGSYRVQYRVAGTTRMDH